MITLLLTVFLVVLISAICSMTEAALYSVPWTYIENLRKQGSATGELLYQLRSRIDQPIAAVLTLNTVANTAGAAIAGAVAANVLGADNTALFAAGLTILILALGEILPKTLGVAHACGVASGMARPLRLMVLIFKPFIWFSSMLTRLVASPQSGPSATEDDIRAITSLSRQTGRIQQYEENAIRNILSLDVKHVREIMTPRTMVFSLQEDISVKDAYNHPQIWHYSRIPVYGDDNEDIVGIVLRKDIGRYVSQGQGEKTLFDIMQPVRFVLENQTVDKLLLEFLESRLHLFIVLDEYGGLAGVVSLEDVQRRDARPGNRRRDRCRCRSARSRPPAPQRPDAGPQPAERSPQGRTRRRREGIGERKKNRGRLRGRSPICWKKEKNFFQKFFSSAVRFVQRCPTRKRLSNFYLP